jgi:hypothetical protein
MQTWRLGRRCQVIATELLRCLMAATRSATVAQRFLIRAEEVFRGILATVAAIACIHYEVQWLAMTGRLSHFPEGNRG